LQQIDTEKNPGLVPLITNFVLFALKKTRIKLYNTPALPVLLYGSEIWTIKARDARRITAAGMKYMRRTTGYT
jgi:hypothetical protein